MTANSSSPLSLSHSHSSSPPPPPPPPPSQSPRAVISPCAACKILRGRCADQCVLAPYFPPTEPARFTIAHWVFAAASNIIKFLQVGFWSWCKGYVKDRLTDAGDEDQELLAALEEGNLTHRDVEYFKLLRSTVRSSDALDAGKAVLIAAAILHISLAAIASLSGADTALIMSSFYSFAAGYLVSPPPARGGRRGNQGVVSRARGVLSSALSRFGIIAAFCVPLPDHIQFWVLLAACCVQLASGLIG